MAGDWIKMRGNLWDDPRVARLCDMTDCGEAHVIGGLYWLWSAADQHTEDGWMPGLTIRQIDRKTGVPGLGLALVAIGWLIESDDGVTITNFEEHNGSSAKKRAVTAKRVANHRSGNADVTPEALQNDGASVTGALARERERGREEISVTDVTDNAKPKKRASKASTAERPDDVPEPVWTDFVAMRKAKNAPLTATALDGIEREAVKAGLTLAEALAMCCARGWQGFKADWVAQAQPRQNGPPAETAYQRSMRERWEEATGRRSDGRADGRNVIDITPTQELLP